MFISFIFIKKKKKKKTFIYIYRYLYIPVAAISLSIEPTIPTMVRFLYLSASSDVILSKNYEISTI